MGKECAFKNEALEFFALFRKKTFTNEEKMEKEKTKDSDML